MTENRRRERSAESTETLRRAGRGRSPASGGSIASDRGDDAVSLFFLNNNGFDFHAARRDEPSAKR